MSDYFTSRETDGAIASAIADVLGITHSGRCHSKLLSLQCISIAIAIDRKLHCRQQGSRFVKSHYGESKGY